MRDHDKLTVGEFIQKLDYRHYPGIPAASVVIHPGFAYDFLEVTPEYMEKLKSYMEHKLIAVQAGVDEMTPADQFVAMFFENAY